MQPVRLVVVVLLAIAVGGFLLIALAQKKDTTGTGKASQIDTRAALPKMRLFRHGNAFVGAELYWSPGIAPASGEGSAAATARRQ